MTDARALASEVLTAMAQDCGPTTAEPYAGWAKALAEAVLELPGRGISEEEMLEQMGIPIGALTEPFTLDATKGGPITIELRWIGDVRQWGDVWVVHDRYRDDEIAGSMWLRDGGRGELQPPLELGRHWVARACRWPQVHRDWPTWDLW